MLSKTHNLLNGSSYKVITYRSAKIATYYNIDKFLQYSSLRSHQYLYSTYMFYYSRHINTSYRSRISE